MTAVGIERWKTMDRESSILSLENKKMNYRIQYCDNDAQ